MKESAGSSPVSHQPASKADAEVGPGRPRGYRRTQLLLVFLAAACVRSGVAQATGTRLER
ncbi:MAG: hypothetical protein M3Z75_22250 [Actinomycetota bacterium]|nr:hypothetical protein [Actinomycetota bacterium]